jgi:hypothetical protein
MAVAADVAAEDAAIAAAGLECNGLPEADAIELQYRLGFEHTAVNGCTPERIPA